MAAGSLAGHVAPAAASTAATPYVPMRIDSPDQPPVQVPLRWGERLVAASLPGPLGGNPVTPGDLDGDGVKDFWTAAPFEPIGGNTGQGRVFAVSGRTFQVLYRIDAPVVVPSNAAAFGFYISSPGDVNGDGLPDIVSGTDAQDVAVTPGACTPPKAAEPNGCNERQGQAWVFSGANGALLYSINQPAFSVTVGGPAGPQGATSNTARFGSRIGRAGDVNADGVPDIIMGASNQDVCDTQACVDAVAAAQATPGTQAFTGNNACGDMAAVPAGCRKNQGQAFIFSGTNGALLRTLNLPAADQVPGCTGLGAAPCGNFGLAVQSPGDLTGDGVADQQVDASALTVAGSVGQGRVYLFNGATGAVLSRIDDPVPQGGATFGFQDAAPNSPGDINSDGVPDIYANGFGQDGPAGAGQGRAWIFDGAASVAAGTGVVLVTVDDPSPELGGQFGWSMTTTDYNNDAKADYYVGQSPHHVAGATGSGGTYVFNGPASAAAHVPVLWKPLELPEADRQISTPSDLGPNLGWGLAAPGDLDGDGNQDYLGGAPFKNVNGVINAGQIFAFQSKERPPTADFDGNTTTDISVFRPSTGQWWAAGSSTVGAWGTSGDVPVNADYNGDGIAELAVWRPSTGTWFIQGGTTVNWGTSGDIPVPADYNGDGKADIVVYRPSNGAWFTLGSPTVLWGTSGDIPVPGDYNGDGSTDIAVFRPSTGTWFIRNVGTVNWGTDGDIPVPGDYNGDHTTEIAVYRPSTGAWFVKDGPTTFWGTPGDIPEPGDYDGNGTTDIAVYRPDSGYWFVQGGPTVNWGTTGDIPLPLPSAIRQFIPPPPA